MWKWYSEAAVCYVFLSDIISGCPELSDEGANHWMDVDDPSTPRLIGRPRHKKSRLFYESFRRAKWFRRGWTLQELIAPANVVFYSVRTQGEKRRYIGSKANLVETISALTKIDVPVLLHQRSVSSMSVAKRMSWAAGRKTRRTEDRAYCLLGLFDVNTPMLYGEGVKSFSRLQEEIIKISSDHSIFAWGTASATSNGSLLARSPDDFAGGHRIATWGLSGAFEMTNRGLRITLPVLTEGEKHAECSAILNCRFDDRLHETLALRLSKSTDSEECHVVVSNALPSAGSAISPRIRRLDTRKITLGHETPLHIDREFSQPSASVRIALYCIPNTDYALPRTLELLPRCGQWSRGKIRQAKTEGQQEIEAHILHTEHKPLERAGVVLGCESGARVLLVFGFDRYPPNDITGRLIPLLWARNYGASFDIEESIDERPLHDHGMTSKGAPNGCVDHCPLAQTSTTLRTIGGKEMFHADIMTSYELCERLFTVSVSVRRASQT